MSEQGRSPHNEEPKKPWLEVPSGNEYSESMRRLKAFSILPIDPITTLGDLESAATGIGNDLRVILASYGSLITIHHPAGDDPRRIYTSTIIGEDGIARTLEGRVSHDRVVINKYAQDDLSKPIYAIDIPYGSFVHGNALYGAAVFPNPGNELEFIPVDGPVNGAIQQGYAHILQVCIKDLLNVVPDPTEIPPEIADQFKE